MSGKPNDKLMKTLAKKHGSDEAARAWLASIGAIGGKNSKGGGFAQGEAGRERARIYGAIGGRISRRPKKVHVDAAPTEVAADIDERWRAARARLVKKYGVPAPGKKGDVVSDDRV